MATAFARVSGWTFIVLGILGFFVKDLFGLIQFDATHNALHLLFGILGIAAAVNNKVRLYAVIFGTIYLLLGLAGFFVPTFLGMHLEALENLLHLILGAWGLYAGVYKKA